MRNAKRTGLAVLCIAAALAAGAAVGRSGRRAGSSVPGAAAVERGTHSLEHGGLNRTFRLYVPDSYDTAEESVPLVVVLHGGHGNARSAALLTGFDELADRVGCIVAYPEAVGSHWNDGRGIGQGADDVGFIARMLDHLIGRLQIDPRRVYVAGVSNGAMMTLRIACELADRVAAVAPVIGSMPEPLLEQCAPARPIPVLFINGTEDPLVPWEGGEVASMGLKDRGRVASVDDTVAFWVRHNRCKSTPVTTMLFGSESDDRTEARREEYAPERQGAPVTMIRIEGGGHTWPGGPRIQPRRLLGPVSRDIDATEEIWAFFGAHTLP